MSNQPETNETPATGYTPAPRKVGLPRFLNCSGRRPVGVLPRQLSVPAGLSAGTVLAVFGQMGGSALLTVLGGLLGGLIGGPFLSGMIDTTLRALRDEPGYWWHTYKRAWKQNWKQSLLPVRCWACLSAVGAGCSAPRPRRATPAR